MSTNQSFVDQDEIEIAGESIQDRLNRILREKQQSKQRISELEKQLEQQQQSSDQKMKEIIRSQLEVTKKLMADSQSERSWWQEEMLKLKRENETLAERVSRFGEQMASLAEHQQQMRPLEQQLQQQLQITQQTDGTQSQTQQTNTQQPQQTQTQTQNVNQKQGKKRQREQIAQEETQTQTQTQTQQEQTNQSQPQQKYSELDLQAITDDLLGLKSELLITKKALIHEKSSFETLERESQTRILGLEQRQREIEALSTNTLSILEQGQLLLNKQKEKLMNELKIVSKEMEMSREKLLRLDTNIKSLTLLDPEELSTLKLLLENISISLNGTNEENAKKTNENNVEEIIENEETQKQANNQQQKQSKKNGNKNGIKNENTNVNSNANVNSNTNMNMNVNVNVNNNKQKQQKATTIKNAQNSIQQTTTQPTKKETPKPQSQTQQPQTQQTQTKTQQTQTQEKIYEQLEEEINSDSQKRCTVCGKPSLHKCGKCQAQFYCSTNCQRQDWNKHKSFCHSNSSNSVDSLDSVQ